MLTQRYGAYAVDYSFPDQEGESPYWLTTGMIPEQISETSSGIATERPEASLMRAVLDDAIMCFQHQFVASGAQSQRLAREAERWFFSDDTDWPFAFVNICSVLGLDPGYVRRGLRSWHAGNRPAKVQRRKRRVVRVRGLLKLVA